MFNSHEYDAIDELIENQRQQLHDATNDQDNLLKRFFKEALSPEDYKKIVKKAYDLKKQSPESFQKAKNAADSAMASTYANQRHDAQKKLNRKAAHKRTWVWITWATQRMFFTDQNTNLWQ